MKRSAGALGVLRVWYDHPQAGQGRPGLCASDVEMLLFG
jgi:hypothetical protein